MKSYPPILAAALAALAVAAPAAAQSAVAVRYSDLDLSTTAGQAQLERRIHNAAREVCGMNEVTVGTRLNSTASQRCLAETKTRLHDQVAATIARENGRG